MNINERIAELRKGLTKHDLSAFIIPGNDPHNSEYAPSRWEGRAWISGFTGSAGTVVISQNESGLWTDSRYFLQAEDQLSTSEMVLHKMYNQFSPSYINWIADNVASGSKVGVAGEVLTKSQFNMFKKILDKKGIHLVIQLDVLDEVWTDRPDIPDNPIFEHKIEFAGKSREDKLAELRSLMSEKEVEHHLITTLDDICWLYNIRGTDVNFNPVIVCHTLVSTDKAYLFLNENKVSEEIKQNLTDAGVVIKPYDAIIEVLNNVNPDDHMLVDPAQCNMNLVRAINCNITEGMTITRNLKAVKNETEIAHTKYAMVKDGAAIAETFFWLENKLNQDQEVTEADFSDKLAENRGTKAHYRGESFPAIIGYQSNGAVIHYRPMHGSAKTIKKEGILLADSGGQYLDGTTDITRTIALSEPTAEQMRNFTLVLKGNIALSRAKFPKGTTGVQLDTFARQYLWSYGLNYLHGTGHGVGFFMNVHEAPQGFAPGTSERAKTAHVPGMLSSNEPGYYKDGGYGIRIENLMFVVESGNEEFYEFDTVTLYPIDTTLIDHTLMNAEERTWLNNYHKKVEELVSPLLEGDVKSWFMQKCKPLD